MSTDTSDDDTRLSVDDVRRALMRASRTWQNKADERGYVLDNPFASDDEKIAVTASLMAANYSYTLAAVLGIAQQGGTMAFARHLAWEVDEILSNGDFGNVNADVTPPEGS